MSSDSDEDELLQIALKEQATRDLNYAKPSQQPSSRSSKPILNYVQPPSNYRPPPPPPPQQQQQQNPNKASLMQQRNHQQRKSLDDDEDSEVEMLSISSGDEDSVSDRKVGGSKNRARGGSRSGGGKDDDRGWDGDEPAVWKHVDESELGRRVREMRETRAVPVAQKFERKPSTVRRGLNNLQSFPRGMECIDPLGLGVIDNRTLRLINEYTASSPSKDKDYLDTNLRGLEGVGCKDGVCESGGESNRGDGG